MSMNSFIQLSLLQMTYKKSIQQVGREGEKEKERRMNRGREIRRKESRVKVTKRR